MGARKPKAQGKKPDPDFLDQITEFFLPSDKDPSEVAASELTRKLVKCFLCGRWPDVRISKKGRPYFVCDPCGMQVFVRGDKGIERLKKQVREES